MITLTAGGEPTGEAGQGGMQDSADDDNGDMTVDFGFVPPPPEEEVSVGSTVFLDTNDNGMQDAGEAGLPGVLVEVLDASPPRPPRPRPVRPPPTPATTTWTVTTTAISLVEPAPRSSPA